MISVIFPIFNCERLLNDSINSILNQTFKEFELICIDNNSTDSSLTILRQFEKQDSRIKVFSCDENHDLPHFINFSIQCSENKYIYFFEPHFVLRSDSFESFLSISENNQIDYLIFNYDVVNQDNASNSRFDLDEDFKIYEDADLNSDFLFKIPISLGNAFLLKSFILESNFYFDENLYENLYKLRFNSQKGMAINESFAAVEKDMGDYINSIHEESDALFSIFQWLFEYNDIYEYYKANFLNFVLDSFKGLYDNLINFNYSNDQIYFYRDEKNKFVNNLKFIFDKFYFDYKICDDIKLVSEPLFDFFNEFLINKGKYRLSIVIPVFNCESYIHDTLNSIINQTIDFKTIEVIMVDDCSQDNSPLVIEEYSKKYDNFKSFFLEKNSSYAGKPRNIALSHASGNYVTFLDADDYFYPTACENLYYNLLYENADIVIGNFTMDKNSHEKKVVMDAGISYFRNLANYDSLKFNTVRGNPHIFSSANVWNKIFKMDIIMNNDIIFPEGVPAQDSAFLYHYLLNADNIVFIDEIVTHYHNLRNKKDDKSVTHLRTKSNITGRIEVYEIMYNLSLKYNIEEIFIVHILRLKLPYWFKQLIETDLTEEELRYIFEKYHILFKKCIDYKVSLPKKSKIVFEMLSKSDFDHAIEKVMNYRSNT